MKEINWAKTGSDGSEMTAVSNDREASIDAMKAGGWMRLGVEEKPEEKSIDDIMAIPVDDMSANDLKAVFKHIGQDYPGKSEAVVYLKSKAEEKSE